MRARVPGPPELCQLLVETQYSLGLRNVRILEEGDPGVRDLGCFTCEMGTPEQTNAKLVSDQVRRRSEAAPTGNEMIAPG